MKKLILGFIIVNCFNAYADFQVGEIVKINLEDYQEVCETNMLMITGKVENEDEVWYELENVCVYDGVKQRVKMFASEENIMKITP
jgi:hypothetical protein